MGGLGETISTKMAGAGYRVVVTYSPSNTKYRAWLEEMKGRGHSFSAYPVDVVSYDDCARKCAQIQGECGPVDILVNNAGITRDMTFKKMTKAAWDEVMRTNLDSCFNMTKQVMDGMVERAWGRVINVSSVNGQKGAFGQTNYSAAKAGIHGFTKALALEVARKNVTVNTISPGYIGTQMVLKQEDFQVVDAKSGDDLTRQILLQIILEEESGGVPMFSSDLLSQLIRSYGNAMQGMMGSYLERNIRAFQDIQKALQEQSHRMYGDNSRASQELWAQFMNLQGPAMQSLMQAYMEQSQKMFSQFQEQMQSQARNMFSGLSFPGFPPPSPHKNEPEKQ